MANVKVRLKDASNNVLHPETDWSVVLNKPSIKLQYTDGKYGTSTNSMVADVSGQVGREGEAWDTYSNGGKSIVIGNNDNALGFCGTNSKQKFMVLQSRSAINIAAGNINMAATGNINIKSKETGNQSVSLANYPIKWSAISGKPNYIPTDIRDVMFGQYSTVARDPDGVGYHGMIYPAIRTADYSSNPGGDSYAYTYFYFNETSWVKFTDDSKFIPGA